MLHTPCSRMAGPASALKKAIAVIACLWFGAAQAEGIGAVVAPAAGPTAAAPTSFAADSARSAPMTPATPAPPSIVGSGEQVDMAKQDGAQPQQSFTTEAESALRTAFQDFVKTTLGRDLPIYGESLFRGRPSTFAPVTDLPVPADYLVGTGDELVIQAWGQLQMQYRATVDRSGNIYIPQVGQVNVAGVPYADLNQHIKQGVGKYFKGFELSVSLGKLRSIQIYVVGAARQPGAYTVSSLSSLVSAVFASGGPRPDGSMRRIQLKRGDRVVKEFDLYDLLLAGDKSKDVALRSGDVIFIPAIGNQVALAGSVNNQAIFELKPGEVLGDLLRFAGGLSTTAAGHKAMVERNDLKQKSRMVDQFMLDEAGRKRPLADGDIVNVLPLLPKIGNAITLRGAVAAPFRAPWTEGMRISDLIPDPEILISVDYWQHVNGAILVDTNSTTKVLTEIKRRFDEINWRYAAIERLDPNGLNNQLIPFDLEKAVIAKDATQNLLLRPGDIVTIFSKADIAVPLADRSKYVRIEGEVARPGVYQLQPDETLRSLLQRVGGLTPKAYIYGAQLTRESLQLEQQERLTELTDRLEQEMNQAQREKQLEASSAETLAAYKAEQLNQQRYLQKLRSVKASGRLALEVSSDLNNNRISALPDLPLQDGDKLLVPARPEHVLVQGSVYNQSAFLYREDRSITDYIKLAGGPTRNADRADVFVIRANGSVYNDRNSGWFSSIGGARVMPGDTIVVPEDFDKSSWMRELKDWSQIIYQFALGAAAYKSLN